MPKSVVDWVNFIGWDQPQQAVFTDRSGNAIGDGDADYEEDPTEQAADLPGEVIPEVAPDHVKITGVDMEDDEPSDEPIESQTGVSMIPVEIPGVDLAHQTIEINDLDVSPPPEPALVEPTSSNKPRQSGRERKTIGKYVPSMSGKSYAYTQLGISFLQDTRYKYSSELVSTVLTQLSLQTGKKARVGPLISLFFRRTSGNFLILHCSLF
jgi:hypothetical protein